MPIKQNPQANRRRQTIAAPIKIKNSPSIIEIKDESEDLSSQGSSSTIPESIESQESVSTIFGGPPDTDDLGAEVEDLLVNADLTAGSSADSVWKRSHLAEAKKRREIHVRAMKAAEKQRTKSIVDSGVSSAAAHGNPPTEADQGVATKKELQDVKCIEKPRLRSDSQAEGPTKADKAQAPGRTILKRRQTSGFEGDFLKKARDDLNSGGNDRRYPLRMRRKSVFFSSSDDNKQETKKQSRPRRVTVAGHVAVAKNAGKYGELDFFVNISSPFTVKAFKHAACSSFSLNWLPTLTNIEVLTISYINF